MRHHSGLPEIDRRSYAEPPGGLVRHKSCEAKDDRDQTFNVVTPEGAKDHVVLTSLRLFQFPCYHIRLKQERFARQIGVALDRSIIARYERLDLGYSHGPQRQGR